MDSQLKRNVEDVVKGIENGVRAAEADEIEGYAPGDILLAPDYLELHSLEVEHIIKGDGSYAGSRILLMFGGPTIWVDTSRQVVEGFGVDGEYQRMNYSRDAMGIDEYLEELFHSNFDAPDALQSYQSVRNERGGMEF